MKRAWMLYAACLLTLFLASPAAGVSAQVKTVFQSSALAQNLFSSNPFSIAILDSRFGKKHLARREEDMRITLPAAESHTLVLLGLGLIGFASILRWRIARTSTGRAK
jgi:hypothetical protein